MTKKSPEDKIIKNYKKTGIVAAIVVAIAVLGVWAVASLNGNTTQNVSDAIEVVSEDAANGANMRIAVIRMDAIQMEANALKDLRKQRETYENKLREELDAKQKELEKEKKEIEKTQDVLSHEALQRRVVDYQNRITKMQRDLTRPRPQTRTSSRPRSQISRDFWRVPRVR